MREKTDYVRRDEGGVMRVADTQVPLDSVIAAFEQGASPETIQQQYGSYALSGMNRRSFLAATVLPPFAAALAAENNLRIRIGQIGTSHSHAAGKMGALRALSHFYEVVGIAEPIAGREALAEKQKAYAGLKWFTEEALLSDSSVEAIVVETSLADSPRAAQACLRAGKHIHLDKPGAASHAKFRALRLEAERRRLPVQMGYHGEFEDLARVLRGGLPLAWSAEHDITVHCTALRCAGIEPD